MKHFGMRQNCAAPAKLKYLLNTLRNLWMPSKKYTICFGRLKAEKYLGFEPVEVL
jgi:hypothetical protein